MYSKLMKVSVLTLLAYLLQATLAEYISVWDVAPNIALAIIAIITVCLGRKYTFMMALSVGYLLEIMLPMMSYMNLILYPVSAMIGALIFSDKSERRLEEERTAGKRTNQLTPYLRGPLCAGVNLWVFEGVNLFYTYLSGVNLDSGHFWRAVVDVSYSMLLAGVLQFPIRFWMGMHKIKKAR
ncbi:MAG: hypothetical protein RR824_07710 [Clostridia bacterium]